MIESSHRIVTVSNPGRNNLDRQMADNMKLPDSEFIWSLKRRLRYVPISPSATRSFEPVLFPILLSEVQQERRRSGNGDREAIVVEAGLCEGEGEREYTVYDPPFYFRPFLQNSTYWTWLCRPKNYHSSISTKFLVDHFRPQYFRPNIFDWALCRSSRQ